MIFSKLCVPLTFLLITLPLFLSSPTAYLNALSEPANSGAAFKLQQMFRALDADRSGLIQQHEIQQALDEDRLSHGESLLLSAFDTDNDGAVSSEEFQLGPYQLSLIEMATEVSPDDLAAAEFDNEGVEPTASHSAPAAAKHRQVLMELKAALTQSPASTPPKGAKKRQGALPLSQFGVPSFADEECVMCQYLVQRIQKNIHDVLKGEVPGQQEATTPNGGLGGKAVAAQQALEIRKTNSALQTKSGGRGIVRITTLDTVNQVCAFDRMPILFSQYCESFREGNTINAIRKAVFFNIPFTEICSTARLCRDNSYLVGNAAIHSAKTSAFLNSQRGICGMLGGSRDRRGARQQQLAEAVCEAHPNSIVTK